MIRRLHDRLEAVGLNQTRLTDHSAALLKRVAETATLSALAISGTDVSAQERRLLGKRYIMLRGLPLDTPHG